MASTDFINTIPPEREPWFPGDEHVERRIRAHIRWNAASLYEVGFNHFFRGEDHGKFCLVNPAEEQPGRGRRPPGCTTRHDLLRTDFPQI